MRRKARALAALLVFFCGFAFRGGAESVLQKMTQEIPASTDEEAAPILRMLPLDDSAAAEVSTEGEETASALRMLPLDDSAPAEVSTEGEEASPVLRMLPLDDSVPAEVSAEAEETAPVLQMVSLEIPVPAITEAPDARGMRIRGPERMKAGTKKYYKPVYDEEKPRKTKVTWSLDCDAKTAQVYRNGQVWVKKKAAAGTVLTLRCHVEGKDAQGQPWVAETTMEITVQ